MTGSERNSATPLSNIIPVPPKSLIFLHEWWLVNQRKGLAVGGVASVGRDRERVFLSTLIAEREEANVLHTQDGITILFRGLINSSRSSQNGVPSLICQHFLVGFPHDWKKYSAHSFPDEDIVSGDSSASSNRRDDDALPFSIDNNDFTKRHSMLSNNCVAPKKFCNELGSESTDNTECGIVLKTMECECNNGGKGISVEMEAGKSTTGQSFMATYDSNMCADPSGKSMVKPPTSTKKMTRDQFSGDRKEKQHIRQKIVLDASNSCSRRVTRNMSKRSHTML